MDQLNDDFDLIYGSSPAYETKNELTSQTSPKTIQIDYDKQFSKVNFCTEQIDILDLLDEPSRPQIAMLEYIKFIQNRILIVEGPELISEGYLTSYKLYTIKSKTVNSQTYDTCVTRRFSDFQFLQSKLLQKKGGCIIPLLPEKNFWSSLNWQGQEFVSLRRKKLQKYLMLLLKHEKLRITEEIRSFLFSQESLFSQQKGQYFAQMKTEDKLKNYASTAYEKSLSLLNYVWTSETSQQRQKAPNITRQDVVISEYQIDINQLLKITGQLKKLVNMTIEQINTVQAISQSFYNFKDNLKSTSISTVAKSDIDLEQNQLAQQFQDLCEFILSCYEAIERRKKLRIQIQNFKRQQKQIIEKNKNNPRNSQLDIIRSRITRNTKKYQLWTSELIEELSKNLSIGKSMVEKFVKAYYKSLQQFYSN